MSEGSGEMKELSEAQYQALIEETSDVISVIQSDGTIQYQSPNTEQIKGWPREKLIGENILDYIHPEDRDRVVQKFESLTQGADYIDNEVEFRFQTEAGEWIWLATTGTAPGPDSPIDGFITTSRDITSRKEAEQQLKSQRDDLELLNQVVRHDIRNDLQVVATYAEILEDHVDEKGKEHLERLKESNGQAVELTTTARDLTGVILQSDSEPQPVPLLRTINEELAELQSSQPAATLTVNDSVPDIEVLADEMLGAVFRNLLKNAIQHNNKDRPKATVSATLEDDLVTVRVIDNGPGIRDSQKQSVFGKTEKGLESDGTGIGLYLVRELVTNYGGDVWVEDREKDTNGETTDGAVFVVQLPRAD